MQYNSRQSRQDPAVQRLTATNSAAYIVGPALCKGEQRALANKVNRQEGRATVQGVCRYSWQVCRQQDSTMHAHLQEAMDFSTDFTAKSSLGSALNSVEERRSHV